ncbi:uncharacterized, partial [Tachysurus ichikawai]
RVALRAWQPPGQGGSVKIIPLIHPPACSCSHFPSALHLFSVLLSVTVFERLPLYLCLCILFFRSLLLFLLLL